MGTLAEMASLAPAILQELTEIRRNNAHGMTYGRGPFLHRVAGSRRNGRISALECLHKDCPARLKTGRGGILTAMATPETASTLGRKGETLLGVICLSCRRLPGLPRIVFPRVYLENWVGGRRQQVSGPHGILWIGSYVA